MNHQQERKGDPTRSRRRKQSSRKTIPRLTLRIDFGGSRAVGPGKIKLMEMIDKHGSISEAGRQMGMSYRRAWLLVDSLNRCFRAPVVASQKGGQRGGGASLTEFGHALLHHYRAVESGATMAGAAHLEALSAALAKQTTPPGIVTPRPLTLRLD
jgi:molybdate transport system regulatory protein